MMLAPDGSSWPPAEQIFRSSVQFNGMLFPWDTYLYEHPVPTRSRFAPKPTIYWESDIFNAEVFNSHYNILRIAGPDHYELWEKSPVQDPA